MVSGEEAVCIHPTRYEVGILASLHTIMNISLPLSSLIAYLELKHSRHTRRCEFTVQADNHETAFLRRMTPLCICIPIAKKTCQLIPALRIYDPECGIDKRCLSHSGRTSRSVACMYHAE
jgi:hypothetical protein